MCACSLTSHEDSDDVCKPSVEGCGTASNEIAFCISEKYLRDNDRDVCFFAAAFGYLELLKWAITNGCRWHKKEFAQLQHPMEVWKR
jgi:hypothetical protein